MYHPTTDRRLGTTLLMTSVYVLGLLNSIGGIVAGIWLAILGEWWIVFVGILIGVGSTIGISLLLLPGMVFAPLVLWTHKRNIKSLFVLGSFLSILYTIAVMAVWCVGILLLFIQDVSGGAVIPILLWAYAVSFAPWAHMAKSEQNEYSVLTVIAGQSAFLVMAFMLLFGAMIKTSVLVFGVLLSVWAVCQTTLACIAYKNQ